MASAAAQLGGQHGAERHDVSPKTVAGLKLFVKRSIVELRHFAFGGYDMTKTLAELKAASEAKKAAAASAKAPGVVTADAVDPEVQAIIEASMSDDEKTAAADASQKDEPLAATAMIDAGEKVTDGGANPNYNEVEDLRWQLEDAKAQNAELRAKLTDYEAKHGRAAEGLKAVGDALGVVNTGSVQMAGHLPQDVSLIPTVDQINAAGQ